jgi:site-specific DNA recombinase
MGEPRRNLRCAIYTRKSTEEGLDQNFNSLTAQREAAEAFIASQRAAGWMALDERYDDGGFSGAHLDRPALQQLLAAIAAGRIDCVMVYKVDRLSRSLLDFARLMSLFDRHKVSFVSVTQEFNTTTSLGRLTLNILLSFAHYAECAIMQSGRAKVAVWPVFWRRGTPHYPGSKSERSARRQLCAASPSGRDRRYWQTFSACFCSPPEQ